MITSEQAASLIQRVAPAARQELNRIARELLQTRGGRAGSGLGSLLEAMWGFCMNAELRKVGAECELAWFPEHAYDDFACVFTDKEWRPGDLSTELLRIEAKSMYLRADESKGHFNVLQKQLAPTSLLVILLWDWVSVDPTKPHGRCFPLIFDDFIGPALPIARLRDELHVARGGTFVASGQCPDGCGPDCLHVGEPLNASGSRERKEGPKKAQPANSSMGANFGGLVRMLGARGTLAKTALRELRTTDYEVHRYLSFIHRNYPNKETSHYLPSDWVRAATELGIPAAGLSTVEVQERVRAHPSYPDVMRLLH